MPVDSGVDDRHLLAGPAGELPGIDEVEHGLGARLGSEVGLGKTPPTPQVDLGSVGSGAAAGPDGGGSGGTAGGEHRPDGRRRDSSHPHRCRCMGDPSVDSSAHGISSWT